MAAKQRGREHQQDRGREMSAGHRGGNVNRAEGVHNRGRVKGGVSKAKGGGQRSCSSQHGTQLKSDFFADTTWIYAVCSWLFQAEDITGQNCKHQPHAEAIEFLSGN